MEKVKTVKNTFEAMKKGMGKYMSKDGTPAHENAEGSKKESKEHKKGGEEYGVKDEESKKK